MINLRQLSLFVALTFCGILIGGVMYSHIVYFPAYLSHLPESNQLIKGEYGLHDENFWMAVHPVAIISTIATLILNWRIKSRRKPILIALSIYLLAIGVTAIYFVPNLLAFANSDTITTVSPSEWYNRGQMWQHLSWLRGGSLYIGFLMLLSALTKNYLQHVPVTIKS
jgi:phosphoglycerol transferase MdoB-like AlkP superfamily enzyme